MIAIGGSRLLLLTTLLLSLTACVVTSFRPAQDYVPGILPPISPAAVRIFRSPSSSLISTYLRGFSDDLAVYRSLPVLPKNAYRILGQVEADVTGFPSLETTIGKARERAARIGADAIVIGMDVFWVDSRWRIEYANPKLVYASFTAIRFEVPASR